MSGKCTDKARCLIMKTIAWSLEVLSSSVLTGEEVSGIYFGCFSVLYLGDLVSGPCKACSHPD